MVRPADDKTDDIPEIKPEMIEAGHRVMAEAYLSITSAPGDFREIAKTVYLAMEAVR